MTDFRTERTLAGRVKAARKQRGFKSTRELAESIQGSRLTQSVLDNIESGRKVNLDVSDLLNLAMDLRLPPSFLLAPLGSPDAGLDLPGLSDSFTDMNAIEFDAWLTGVTGASYHPKSTDERSTRLELEAARDWYAAVAEINRLTVAEHLDDDPNHAMSARACREDLLQRAGRLAEYLRISGWLVTTPPL